MASFTASTNRRAWWAVAVLLLVAVAAAAGLLAGARLAPEPAATPATDSVAAGFARDMKAHHAQAVQMSVLVRDRTEDPDVRTLALDILLGQQHQIGQMYAWLDQWNLPQTSPEPAMAWMPDDAEDMTGMDHDSPTPTAETPMPGMATDEQLDRLRNATGVEAERLYLQLMIPHHQAGVEMAEVAAARAADSNVRQLAQTIVDSQTAEIAVLRQMLESRGGPLPAA